MTFACRVPTAVIDWSNSGFKRLCLFLCFRYIGALGARVICDNIPGLVNKQRQLCQKYPDIMQSIGGGAKEWIRECQHQFRHHRWNCSALDRDHTVFGRVIQRSECWKCLSVCFGGNSSQRNNCDLKKINIYIYIYIYIYITLSKALIYLIKKQ